MSESLIRKVESVLFGAGRRLSLEHIAKLVKAEEKEVEAALKELKADYEEKDTSLRVTTDGEFWKLTVRDAYAGTVEKLVTQTEFSKTVMETLAVIAYKAPVLQSEVIKIRTNKAYDHIILLDEMGFISRVKQGRSKLIKLAPKFYDYFDLPEDAVQARFAVVREKEKEVAEHERRKKELVEEIKKRKSELQQMDEKQRAEAEARISDLTDEIGKLETYGVKEVYQEESPTQLEKVENKVGELSVYETESKEGTHWGDFTVYTPDEHSPRKKRPEGEEGDLEEGESGDYDEGEPDEYGEGEEGPAPGDEGELSEGEPSEEEPDRGKTPLDDIEIGENPEDKDKKKEPELPPLADESVELDALEQKEGEGMFAQGVPEEVQGQIDKKIDTLLGKKEGGEEQASEEEPQEEETFVEEPESIPEQSSSKGEEDQQEAPEDLSSKESKAASPTPPSKEKKEKPAPEQTPAPKENPAPEPSKKPEPQEMPEPVPAPTSTDESAVEGEDLLSEPMHVEGEDNSQEEPQDPNESSGEDKK